MNNEEVKWVTEILKPIGVIARALDSIANVEFKKFDLTKGQYLYLVRVGENPGIIQEHVAEMIKVDRTTAARSVQKLETKGLITRLPDEKNKKIKRLYLSDQGKKVFPIIERENVYSNQIALESLSEDQATELERLLKIVSQNIDKNWHYVKKGNQRHY
ncbi:MarR family transcriptional regulator [Lentilactobacillus kefiri DSM 20587 = JCM 5818]|uniref:MarR family transcriptional regulator n=1 Tax=Lentilactobacillus kefiri DSM 20587 = JCM 5818 TaxID=1423764 RepID=A0A8E1RIP5_LENKE|nr:MarR family transcriptional regulator [Lentilactobacillus kefiri]KRL56279.1 MarR family transcriptional regulator [Lentilactobacillus parakefiri DSM 10551]KRM51659.1 MarR family transcriptional regulator [Lentilactobacillus kefiri DSM 20587 = JCM 5818]